MKLWFAPRRSCPAFTFHNPNLDLPPPTREGLRAEDSHQHQFDILVPARTDVRSVTLTARRAGRTGRWQIGDGRWARSAARDVRFAVRRASWVDVAFHSTETAFPTRETAFHVHEVAFQALEIGFPDRRALTLDGSLRTLPA
jgi:hypothetical protein